MDKFDKSLQLLIADIFPKFKNILVVILYGSVARKDYSLRHSDLDLFIIVKAKAASENFKENFEREISRVEFSTGARIHPEYQGLDITYEDRTLVRKMIEEGKVIYSTGVFSFSSELVGLKAYWIYEYSLKNAVNKTMFSKVLHGRKSWYWKGKEKIVKEYKGIIDNEGFIDLGKGVIMVRKDKEKDLSNIFKNFQVEYKLKKVVYG